VDTRQVGGRGVFYTALEILDRPRLRSVNFLGQSDGLVFSFAFDRDRRPRFYVGLPPAPGRFDGPLDRQRKLAA
jgi:hypothetical protein